MQRRAGTRAPKRVPLLPVHKSGLRLTPEQVDQWEQNERDQFEQAEKAAADGCQNWLTRSR